MLNRTLHIVLQKVSSQLAPKHYTYMMNDSESLICLSSLKLMHAYLLAKLSEENIVWLQDQFNLYEGTPSNVISHSPQVSRPHWGYSSRSLVCDFNYMYRFLFYCLYFITLMWFISQSFDIIQIWNSFFISKSPNVIAS